LSTREGTRALRIRAAAEPQAPFRGAQTSAQIAVGDPNEFVGFVAGHFRLAETIDESDPLKRVDAARGSAPLGFRDEPRREALDPLRFACSRR
jgi:hypothetical protein